MLPSFQLTSIRLPFKKKRDEALEPSSEWWGGIYPPRRMQSVAIFWRFGQNLGVPGSLQVTVMSSWWWKNASWLGGRSPRTSPSLSHFISHGSHCYWEGRRGDFTNPKIWVFPKIMVSPKSSILVGFSIINHPFWGTPIFGNIHMVIH